MGNLMQGHHPLGHGGSMMPPLIPVPMAVFGAIVSFMLGAMIGMRCADKCSKGGGMGAKPWMHGMGGPKPWMMGGMPSGPGSMMAMAHHHHGNGAPGCCEAHGAGMGAPGQQDCESASE